MGLDARLEEELINTRDLLTVQVTGIQAEAVDL
jgi:hypothetical protein